MQAVQAAQITFEDYFMADLAIEPLQIVGWEGIFGTFFMVAILLPIVSVTPGLDGSGFHEDTLETLHVRIYQRCPRRVLCLSCTVLNSGRNSPCHLVHYVTGHALCTETFIHERCAFLLKWISSGIVKRHEQN